MMKVSTLILTDAVQQVPEMNNIGGNITYDNTTYNLSVVYVSLEEAPPTEPYPAPTPVESPPAPNDGHRSLVVPKNPSSRRPSLPTEALVTTASMVTAQG